MHAVTLERGGLHRGTRRQGTLRRGAHRRGTGRYGRPAAAGITALGVLVGAIATANPASAATILITEPVAVASATHTIGLAAPPPGPVTAVAASPSRGALVVAAAARLAGRPYSYGAAGPRAFDCSGLTLYVYRQFGIRLPHRADTQKRYGRAVPRSQARPGDLIIFLRGGYGYHAGIYAGGGYMWDSPHRGARVGKHKIWSSSVIFRRLV